MQTTCHSYSLLENHQKCVITVFSDCKNEDVAFFQFILYRLAFSNTFVLQIGKHVKQSKLMIFGLFSIFSSFMPIFVHAPPQHLVFSPYCLFFMMMKRNLHNNRFYPPEKIPGRKPGALSGLIMSLPARTTDKTSLKCCNHVHIF